MFFRSVPPPQQLAGFVDNIWLYEGYEAVHANERILPSGTIELVFNLNEDELRIYGTDDLTECRRYSGAVVSGPYKRGFTSDTDEEAFIMGVHFKPGGASPFLGIAADDFADTHVDLDAIWGPSARSLRDQLCEASSSESRFRAINDALTAHLLRPLEQHYAVSAALESIENNPDLSVSELARQVGLSERRFIQVFRSEIGMTPKTFSRINRFQRTRSYIEHLEDPDWPLIAMEFGYFDQSHLIREFREFSGTSPGEYLRQHSRFVDDGVHLKTNHLPNP